MYANALINSDLITKFRSAWAFGFDRFLAFGAHLSILSNAFSYALYRPFAPQLQSIAGLGCQMVNPSLDGQLYQKEII